MIKNESIFHTQELPSMDTTVLGKVLRQVNFEKIEGK